MAEQSVFFDERFLERHAGTIISDPAVAIVELVANAWDAWATEVQIIWSERGDERTFSVTDNGKGMTEGHFLRSWKTIDYNRLTEEGGKSYPPSELDSFAPRDVYGRNGKGRHAAFRFGDPYQVRTWRDGIELSYRVQRGTHQPFEVTEIQRKEGVAGHGTEISTPESAGSFLTSQEVREVLGTRFQGRGTNYLVDSGRFTITAPSGAQSVLVPERRTYFASGMPTTEAALRTDGLSQFYLQLGAPQSDTHVVRAWYKPNILLIWIGALVMAGAGSYSLLDRRRRVGVPAATRHRSSVARGPSTPSGIA